MHVGYSSPMSSLLIKLVLSCKHSTEKMDVLLCDAFSYESFDTKWQLPVKLCLDLVKYHKQFYARWGLVIQPSSKQLLSHHALHRVILAVHSLSTFSTFLFLFLHQQQYKYCRNSSGNFPERALTSPPDLFVGVVGFLTD